MPTNEDWFEDGDRKLGAQPGDDVARGDESFETASARLRGYEVVRNLELFIRRRFEGHILIADDTPEPAQEAWVRCAEVEAAIDEFMRPYLERPTIGIDPTNPMRLNVRFTEIPADWMSPNASASVWAARSEIDIDPDVAGGSMTDRLSTDPLPWPPGFIERVNHVGALAVGRHMDRRLLVDIVAGLTEAIKEYQSLGKLGEWVQLAGSGVSETIGLPDDVWVVTVVDGIDRPSMSFTMDGRPPVGTASRRLRDLRDRGRRGQDETA